MRALLLGGAAVMWAVAVGSVTAADEVVTIAALQADPSRFHLRIVTVAGTARLVQVIHPGDPALPVPPLPPGAIQLDAQCVYLHPAYTFVLVDETGLLPVRVRARPPCVSRHMPAEAPDVVDDEAVVVDVQITAVEQDVTGARRVVPEALAVAIRRPAP